MRAKVTATPSTASPRSRSASRQSAIADRLLIASPMPDRAHRGLAAAHVVEVDDHRDRHLHADRRTCGPPRPRARRPARRCRRARGWWPPPPAAGRTGWPRTWRRRACGRRRSPRRRRRSPARSRARELGAGLHGAALDVPDLGVGELRPQRGGDLLAEPRPDDHRHVAAAGDPAVGEQRRQPRHGARSDVDRQRRADHAGQQRHATSRARARSRVVVDLDPLDGPDRRDADAPAAVGELLEAVLVVERAGRARQVASSASASAAAAAGSISVTPMYSPCAVAGSSALLMRSR